jgi:hypothetical protein
VRTAFEQLFRLVRIFIPRGTPGRLSFDISEPRG